MNVGFLQKQMISVHGQRGKKTMINYVYCPNCGTLMTEFTTFRQCSLCGYRIPPQSVTLTIGREKAKNIAEGKKAYTADMSVLKVSVDAVPVIHCKNCKFYDMPNEFCWKMQIEREDEDYCSRGKRRER